MLGSPRSRLRRAARLRVRSSCLWFSGDPESSGRSVGNTSARLIPVLSKYIFEILRKLKSGVTAKSVHPSGRMTAPRTRQRAGPARAAGAGRGSRRSSASCFASFTRNTGDTAWPAEGCAETRVCLVASALSRPRHLPSGAQTPPRAATGAAGQPRSAGPFLSTAGSCKAHAPRKTLSWKRGSD